MSARAHVSPLRGATRKCLSVADGLRNRRRRLRSSLFSETTGAYSHDPPNLLGETTVQGFFFSPPNGGEVKNQLPPLGPEKWGGNKNSPPGVREMGGKYLKIFRRLRRAIQKTRFLRGFVVVFSDKLPYLRRFSPLTRY